MKKLLKKPWETDSPSVHDEQFLLNIYVESGEFARKFMDEQSIQCDIDMHEECIERSVRKRLLDAFSMRK